LQRPPSSAHPAASSLQLALALALALVVGSYRDVSCLVGRLVFSSFVLAAGAVFVVRDL